MKSKLVGRGRAVFFPRSAVHSWGGPACSVRCAGTSRNINMYNKLHIYMYPTTIYSTTKDP